MSYRICSYPKPDGVPCGSPALRGRKLCLYHLRDRLRLQRSAAAVRRANVLGPVLPPLKSHSAVLDALNTVLQALARGDLDHRRSGRILFNIQQAIRTLPQPGVMR